jgi:hypothetical protein
MENENFLNDIKIKLLKRAEKYRLLVVVVRSASRNLQYAVLDAIDEPVLLIDLPAPPSRMVVLQDIMNTGYAIRGIAVRCLWRLK